MTVGGHTAGAQDRQSGILVLGCYCGPVNHITHSIQREPGDVGRFLPPLQQLFHLIFHSGQGEVETVQLHPVARTGIRLSV